MTDSFRLQRQRKISTLIIIQATQEVPEESRSDESIIVFEFHIEGVPSSINTPPTVCPYDLQSFFKSFRLLSFWKVYLL